MIALKESSPRFGARKCSKQQERPRILPFSSQNTQDVKTDFPAMKIRTLILDDDFLTRDRIRSLLAQEQGVDVVEETSGRDPSFETVTADEPELIFLDVRLCGKDRFAALRSIDPRRAPVTILVAANAQEALVAFEIHALDCLLKPIDQDRFKRALQRAREHLDAKSSGEASQRRSRLLEDIESIPQYLTRVKVKNGDRIVFLPVDQIDWVEAADNYVLLHVGKQKHILREKIGALEAALDPGRFFRISRSALVNVAQISELRSMFKGEHTVILNDGSRLPMTRDLQELEELVAFC